MKNALILLLMCIVIAIPYALVTVGVGVITGDVGWAMVTLGVLVFLTAIGVAVAVTRA